MCMSMDGGGECWGRHAPNKVCTSEVSDDIIWNVMWQGYYQSTFFSSIQSTHDTWTWVSLCPHHWDIASTVTHHFIVSSQSIVREHAQSELIGVSIIIVVIELTYHHLLHTTWSNLILSRCHSSSSAPFIVYRPQPTSTALSSYSACYYLNLSNSLSITLLYPQRVWQLSYCCYSHSQSIFKT